MTSDDEVTQNLGANLGDTHVDDRLSDGTDAHTAAEDEDPEEHIGEVILDPWDDEAATDWPNETVDLAEDEEG